MFAIVLLVACVNSANRGTAVVLDGRTFNLRDRTGRRTSCSIHGASIDDTAIATRDAVIGILAYFGVKMTS